MRPIAPARRNAFRISLGFYAIFFFSGVNTMLLSVLIPHLRGLDDRQIGTLFGAQFTGQLLGPLLVSKKPRRTLITGLLGTVATSFIVGFSGLLAPMVLGLYGAALGLTMASTNTLTALESPLQLRGSRVQILNAFWPLGAASTPLFLFLADNREWHAFVIAAGTSIVSLILAFSSPMSSEETHENIASPAFLTRKPALDLGWMCLIAALAGGVEFAVASWTPSLAFRSIGSLSAASTASTFFWVGIVCSRLVVSYAPRRIAWQKLALTFTLLGVLGTGTLALGSMQWILPSVFLSAAGIAPVYPAIIAASVMMRGKNLIFVSAGIGGASLPWLIGRISWRIGTLRHDMLFVSVAFAVLTVLLLRIANRRTLT